MADPKKTDILEEKNIHPNWLTLIKYCGAFHQHGPLTFTTSGGVPMGLSRKGTKEKTVFGKTSQRISFVKEIDATLIRVRLTKKWTHLIEWVTESFPYGQVCIEIQSGEPVRPIAKYTWPDIRFDHPESFPKLVRFYNTQQ